MASPRSIPTPSTPAFSPSCARKSAGPDRQRRRYNARHRTTNRSHNSPFFSAGECHMSGPTRPYEPLTSENAALILIDHQVGLMTGVRDYSTVELKHNVIGLAKGAKAR